MFNIAVGSVELGGFVICSMRLVTHAIKIFLCACDVLVHGIKRLLKGLITMQHGESCREGATDAICILVGAIAQFW